MLIKYPFLAIDPGIHIGLALFLEEFNEPVYTTCIQAKQSSWELSSQVVLQGFKNDVIRITNKLVYYNAYVEKPQFFDTHKGLTAARNDNLFKLIYMYSCITYILRDIGYIIYPLEISKWKGQLNKQQVAARIKRKIGQDYPDHISDAVGIGLHLKGIF